MTVNMPKFNGYVFGVVRSTFNLTVFILKANKGIEHTELVKSLRNENYVKKIKYFRGKNVQRESD